MKRDSALLFQSLLSLVLLAFAGLVGLGLLAGARLSLLTNEASETSHDLVVADRAEWKQFYDAVVGSEPTPEVAQPAGAVPEKAAADDTVEVPAATGVPAPPAPGGPLTVTTTLPPTPLSASPGDQAAKSETPAAASIELPDPAPEKSISAVVSSEPAVGQVPQDAPAVAATETAPTALTGMPVRTPDGNSEKSAESTTPPAAYPLPIPRPKIAAPVPPAPSAARVRQSAPQPEREPERSRPSTPARARVALPKQRSGGAQGNQQPPSGVLSYAPPQTDVLPPGGPQFGPYFPYGSTPPPAQTRRAQQARSPQPAARQPAQTFNDPFGWR